MTQEPQLENPKSQMRPSIKGLPKKRYRLAFGGAILLGVLALVAWLIVHLIRLPGRNILTIYGNVDIRDVNLGFRVPGRIAAVLKDEGDRSTKGELIARLDPATYQEALAERTADVAAKRAALKDSELNYGRNLSLLKERVTSKEQLDDSVSSRDQAAANLDLAIGTKSFSPGKTRSGGSLGQNVRRQDNGLSRTGRRRQNQLMRLMAGLMKLTSGELIVEGLHPVRDAAAGSSARRLKAW